MSCVECGKVLSRKAFAFKGERTAVLEPKAASLVQEQHFPSKLCSRELETKKVSVLRTRTCGAVHSH